MNILIWLFTFLLVVDCLILMLLVLIQLPKKEAGMGQAFGGGATDALFGAGSGTALTKLTKYTAGIFFVLTLLISGLHGHQARSRGGDLRSILTAEDKLSVLPTVKNTNTAAAAAAAETNRLLTLTNAPVEKK
jgi:protein translocase SecG subunit